MSRFAPTVPSGVASLQPFVEAGVLGAAEVHLAATTARIERDVPHEVLLGLAVATRGPALGHVCIDLADVARLVADRDEQGVGDLPWPEVEQWVSALDASPLVATPGDVSAPDALVPPLVLDGARLYLQRYYAYECSLAEALEKRTATEHVAHGHAAAGSTGASAGALDTLHEALDALFGTDDPAEPDLQRRAAEVALTHGISIIAGGPGTGKTRTIARLLAAAQRLAMASGRPLDVALAAPTGKAAARMGEAVRAEVELALADGAITAAVADNLRERAAEATTIHSLLGWAPGTKFRHDRANPLHHDLVIVDETSMAALPLMSRLVDAVRPEAQLVLVGDPSQLASVEAGTVLADVVGPAASGSSGLPSRSVAETFRETGSSPLQNVAEAAPLAGRVTVLQRVRRFAADSNIAALADAIRRGAADEVIEVLGAGHDDVRWVRDEDTAGLATLSTTVVDNAVEVVEHALAGDAAAGLQAATRIKVLAATRRGTHGLAEWSKRIEEGVLARKPKLRRGGRWYVGRPVIVTANDRLTRVSNGDVGLVVRSGDDSTAVAFGVGDGVKQVPTSRLDNVDTWWAMTIHKSQGSEFEHAVVSLPTTGSPILTRELLYTAVTRAKRRVTVVASEAAIREAVERPVARASGLSERLWSSR